MSEPRPISVTGLSIMTALGRGAEAQLAGTPAFSAVTRFDTSDRRVHYAATAAEVGSLEEELDLAIATACAQAGVDRGTTPLLLALHTAPSRDFGQRRVYTSACVSASTALADAATLIRAGRVDRVVVAAAYLVEPHQYALFDAGRALATDHAVRPFSLHRQGTLLGDGVAAVVLEAGDGLAQLVGWSRAGDGYHPVQPAPDGRGLTTAIQSALHKANLHSEDIGYINANATGTAFSDASESAAILRVFAPANAGGDVVIGTEGGVATRPTGDELSARAGLGSPPVSSSKGLHGHALEASGLVEFLITIQALRAGKLPVNAGFLGPDPACDLDVILGGPRMVMTPYGLSLNSAFGGANTALVVRAG